MALSGTKQSSKTSSAVSEERQPCLSRARPTRKARRPLLDQEHGDGFRGRPARVGLGGDTVEVGVDAIGDVELGAVQHEAAIDAPCRGADALHVRTRIRLGHRHRGDDIASDDARHPLRFLRLGAGIEHMDRGHVGVDQRGDGDAAIGRAPQLLRIDDGGQRIHRRAAEGFRVADAEEAEAAHAPQHGARHEARLLPGLRMGLHLLVDEAAHLVAQHLVLGLEEGRARPDGELGGIRTDGHGGPSAILT